MDIRPPSFSRIFDRKLFGYILKHTVEPSVSYRYQTGINDFSQIIRFDQRDILADTNEVRYGIVNRIYAKKSKSTGKCFQQSEIRLAYPGRRKTNREGHPCRHCAAKGDLRRSARPRSRHHHLGNRAEVLHESEPSAERLCPAKPTYSTAPSISPASPSSPSHASSRLIISRLRIQDASTDFGWALDYDPVLHQVNASTVFAGYRWGNWYLNAGQSYLNVPPPNPTIFDQYRIMLLYGNIGKKGLSVAGNMGWDARLHYIQSATGTNQLQLGLLRRYL